MTTGTDNEAIQLGEKPLLTFGMQQKAEVLAEVVGGASPPACRPVMRSWPRTRPPSQAAIDRAAWESPADVRPMANVAELCASQTGWAEKLAGLAETLRLDGFLVAGDNADLVRPLGESVVLRLHELTQGMRAGWAA
jgi:hypothetical protein